MECVISHPNIAPHIKESVLAYQEQDVLGKFYTTYFQHSQYPFSQRLIRFFPEFEKEFRRRHIEEIEYRYLKGDPFHEMLRVFTARFLSPVLMNRVWHWGELHFDNRVARELRPGIDWVHTYQHAALATIRRAKELNIVSFYEQPSQHHDFLSKVLKDQLKKYPELHCTSTNILYDKRASQADARKDHELAECDYIICNSTFTLNTLKSAGIPEEKIICIPLGFPEVSGELPERVPKKKITFMFAGSQCIRKGLHILYKAWKECNFDPEKVELIIIGKNQLPENLRKGLSQSVKFLPNIPHNELMDLYRKADVFVFPTLADGFGMVISEAMSKGLPVITTQNSGGPDIITHQKNGFLVEAGDIKALAKQMKWCYENPEVTRQIGINAMETAAAYPWKAYRKKLVDAVLERVNERCCVVDANVESLSF